MLEKLRRPLIIGLILLVPLTLLAVGYGVMTYGKNAARGNSAAAPPIDERLAYEPRPTLDTSGHQLDTSGYPIVAANIRPWSPDGSLESVAASWRGAGQYMIDQTHERLAKSAQNDRAVASLRLLESHFLNFDGKAVEAYDLLAKTRAEVKGETARKLLYSIIYCQGIASLRRGENENCVMCRDESSCILPISPRAVHANPTGSRNAIKHFTEYLRRFPDDLEVRWLLNLAHMTLGEYPDKVDPKYLVSINRFVNSEFDIGKFKDVAHLAGVNRLNQAGGAIMDDFDNDGRLDLVVSTMDPLTAMAFYRNDGDGTFDDQTKARGLENQLGGLVCYQTDYNNDGLMDIFVPRGAWLKFPVRPSLLRNDGGKFTDVTDAAKLAEPLNSNAASWGDYDNDGFLDVFVACERQTGRLYHNKGDGTFEEVGTQVGICGSTPNFSKGSAWIDYDNDGFLDLFINHLGGWSELFHNDRNGLFTNVTDAMQIHGPNHGFSCWTWDFDNDGWLDIFATCYDRNVTDIVKGMLGESHSRNYGRLYRNIEGKRFEDVTKQAGVADVYSTMGSNFGDFDNDGFLDFYLCTGDPELSTLVPNRMFKNVGGMRFSEITGSSRTGHLQKGHAVAIGDWDRDGDNDLFLEMGGAIDGDQSHNLLFQNPGQGNHWLTIKLVGKKTNRAAIGARIKVVTDGAPSTIHRLISSGSSFGANPLQQTVGLAKASLVKTLEITWPTSKTTQVFHDVAIDQSIEVVEFATEYRKLDATPIPQPK